MTYRVAIGSIFTECTHWCGNLITLDDFARNELRYGEDVLRQSEGTVGGMLQVLRDQRCDIAPLLVASTCPGGPVSADCFARLKSDLLARLQAALPVDGVVLALHGSATVENVDDLEGDLITAVRLVIGDAVPLVATLDLHAHVTRAMVEEADALLAWETYPHRDAFSTGERGARMLLDILHGNCRPVMALAKVPVIVGAFHGGTEGTGPFADCMRLAKSLEGTGNVLSTAAFLVHPYVDLPDMGGGGLVITDNDLPQAISLAEQIARFYWSVRYRLEPEVHSPTAAIRAGLKNPGGPIVLLETADCCGGGAAGDGVAALRALLEERINESALVPVVDPQAAQACHAAGIGQRVTVDLGHHCDPRWGQPIKVTGSVTRLSDGQFLYSGGIWGGQAGHMGPTAVLRIGSIEVMIASFPTYDWCNEQFLSVGLDARRAKFVVVKNPMNFHLYFDDLAAAVFILDTPGPTPATLKRMPFQRLQRPFFPADDDIPGLQPTVYHSRPRTVG